MNINLLLKKSVLLGAAIAIFTQADAQENGVIRTQGVADVKKEVNFMQLAIVESYNKPAPKPIQFIGNKKAREIPEMDVDLTNAKMDPFGKYSSANKTSSGVPSPGPVNNFNGLNDNSTSIPPDVNGAVGPNHIMVTLNTQVRIQDRNGVVLSTVTLDNFWSPLGGLTSTYDPKILYDHFSDRWLFCSSANPQSNTSSTLLAVSKTSDPTQGWNMYKVDVDATNTKWVDYPSIGFNDRWITVQMNLFSMPNSTATSHQIYVWDKADVYNNGTGVFTKFEITNESTAIVCPSIHYDNSTSKMFLLRVSSGNSSGKGTLTMRTLSGTATTPVLSSPTAIQTNNTWASSGANNTNFAPQLGVTSLIATNDHRMRHVVVRDGKVWAVHSVFLPLSGATRSGVQWWQFDTLGNVQQRNIIEDPTGQRFYSFPSIAVNSKNDALIGYASFAPTQYASGAYSFRKSTDAINTFRDEYVFKYGENTYFKDFGGTRNRWGDYTNTVIDPTNDSTFWTIQEYAGSTINTWATWWAHVNPYTDIVDFSVDNNYVCPGESVTFTDKSNFAGSSFQWTFAGGTPASSTDANPTVTYAASGKYRVTLVVDGKTQLKDGYIVVLTNPIRTVNKNNVLPCAGNTITLTASQASGVYLWNTGATTRAIQVTESGTYYCDITAPNGLCSRRSDTVVLNFAALNVTLSDFNAINPNATPLTLTGGQPAGGVYSGPGVSNGVFTPSVAGLGIHTITYTYTSPEGCVATASKTIEVTNAVGLNSNSKITSFSVIPNPSKGLVNLSITGLSNSNVKVQVIDQLGRIVWTKNYDDNSQTIKKEIDLSSLPKGTYFIKADMGDASETQKLIIE
jgi:PKD repeat protein